MICCPPTILPFSNANSTVITYTDAMQVQYGTRPKVFVYYYDTLTGEYYLSPFFTVMLYNPITKLITVDHGGPNTGYIVVR